MQQTQIRWDQCQEIAEFVVGLFGGHRDNRQTKI